MDYQNVYYMDHGDFYKGFLKTHNGNIQFESSNSGKKVHLSKKDMLSAYSVMMAQGLGLRLTRKDGSVAIFSGFSQEDMKRLSDYLNHDCQLGVASLSRCLTGCSEGSLLEMVNGNKQLLEVPLECVSNVTPGKNEIGLQFHPTENAAVSLVEMRLHIDPASNPNRNVDILTREMCEYMTERADIVGIGGGDMLVELHETHCLTPRGKYNVKIFDSHIHLYGKSYDFNISYRSVSRLFLLPHNDERFYYFVMNIDPALRLGQTRHSFVVFHVDRDFELCLTLKSENSNTQALLSRLLTQLSESCQVDDNCVTGKFRHIFCGLISTLSGKKLVTTTPSKKGFRSFRHTPCFMCSHKTTTGLLYPLDKGFVYLYKPTLHIRNEEISGLTFKRGTDSSRTFDVEFTLKGGQSFSFSSIEKDEYKGLYDHIVAKAIVIRNMASKKGAETIPSHQDPNNSSSSAEGSGNEDSESDDKDFDPTTEPIGKQSDDSSDDESSYSDSNQTAEGSSS